MRIFVRTYVVPLASLTMESESKLCRLVAGRAKAAQPAAPPRADPNAAPRLVSDNQAHPLLRCWRYIVKMETFPEPHASLEACTTTYTHTSYTGRSVQVVLVLG